MDGERRHNPVHSLALAQKGLAENHQHRRAAISHPRRNRRIPPARRFRRIRPGPQGAAFEGGMTAVQLWFPAGWKFTGFACTMAWSSARWRVNAFVAEGDPGHSEDGPPG